ncbi:PAS domain S-box protein [Pararcticibacter amylolyticus]|uniref:histidine kinase n=1 Tax=Pararcticibacter amylolyticus TaxID=2173175 RepID=A0A2U2PCT9_9SPHI|nr:PAS domain S-box protein [Pararcticibacter amylolyticus]PWG78939.1 hypothetical protein DDR33_20015 [Pararcticibacter amylolyticus]
MKRAEENLRLKELESYHILGTAPDKEFDGIVGLVAKYFDTPIALITIIGSDRTWFKARYGMKARHSPAEHSFCTKMLDNPAAPLIVTDASTDEQFKNNYWVVNEPHLRFFAGVPLLSANGYLLGSLCVVDRNPREVNPYELKMLTLLAARVMNVIEARKAALELKQEKDQIEQQLEYISEHSPVALFQLSLDNQRNISFDFLSKSLSSVLTEMSPDKIRMDTGHFFEAVHPDYRQIVEEQLIAATGERKKFDAVFRTESGHWCLARANPVIQQGLSSLCGTLEDVSNWVEREIQGREKLRRTREQYKKMVDEVEDYVILLLDAKGNIQNWNLGAEKIKGYRAGEIIGMNHAVFYTEEDRSADKPAALLRIAAETGKAIDSGWRVRKDGSRFMAFVVITALHDSAGEVIGFSKVTRDMTKEKEYINEIEKQNQLLMEIAYVQSHHVRAPLSRIMGILDLITGPQLSGDETAELMKAMIYSCKELDQLVHRISDNANAIIIREGTNGTRGYRFPVQKQ